MVFLKTYANMSFKRRYFSPSVVRSDEPFTTPTLTPVKTDSGSSILSVINVSVEDSSRNIPNVEDYSLEKLINANIPLHPVSASISGFVSSDELENFSSKLQSSDNK